MLADSGLKSLRLLDPTGQPQTLEQSAGRAPKDGGFNIEGLASMSSGTLLIGFRSPLAEGKKAIIVPLETPSALIESGDGTAEVGGKAKFGAAIPIDLEGRGIRSLERVGEEYWIVAGPAGEDNDSNAEALHPKFRLYRWSGVAGGDPVPVGAAGDFGESHPEAIFAIGNPAKLVVLADDGEQLVGSKRCKKLDDPGQKSFGSFVVEP